MVFPPDEEVEECMNGITNVKAWVQESKQYILNNWDELIQHPNQVMVMETKSLIMNTVTNVTVDILVNNL